MRPVIINFTSSNHDNKTIFPTEGIMFKENGRQKFLITELLSEEVTYITNKKGKQKATVGTIVFLNIAVNAVDIEMDDEKYKYWSQYIKLRKL